MGGGWQFSTPREHLAVPGVVLVHLCMSLCLSSLFCSADKFVYSCANTTPSSFLPLDKTS